MKHFLFFMLMSVSGSLYSQNDTLYYFGDPMCSWCYGFSSELDKIKEAFPKVPFVMIMGGLRAGGKERYGDLGTFLSEHWDEVHEATGQPFDKGVLKNKDLYYDTEPACRAVVVVGTLHPDLMYPFFKKMQSSFYAGNKPSGNPETYADIAKKTGVDRSAFLTLFASLAMKEKTREHFITSQEMGAQGFPTLMARIKGKIFTVTTGFQIAENIIRSLKNLGITENP